jgi:hypothetical protein
MNTGTVGGSGSGGSAPVGATVPNGCNCALDAAHFSQRAGVKTVVALGLVLGALARRRRKAGAQE